MGDVGARRVGWVRISGVVAAVPLIVIAASGSFASADNLSRGSAALISRKVVLESAESRGPAPLTPELSPQKLRRIPTPATPPSTAVPVPPTAPATTLPPSTATPAGPTIPPSTAPAAATAKVGVGPFGGTGDNALCDRDLLVRFLTDPANAQQAKEWARVLEIDVAAIPAFVKDLIPTTLGADTRVTNHTFKHNKAIQLQSVLQKGTAVLVDTKGKLVARCRCGNPLLAPQLVKRPRYSGDAWKTFKPNKLVEVVPASNDIFAPGSTLTGPGQQALDLLRAAVDPCNKRIAKGGEFDADALTSSMILEASETSDPTRVKVRAVLPPVGGDDVPDVFGTWSIDTTTGKLTPLDDPGKEVAQICPELAGTPSAFAIIVNLSGPSSGGPESVVWSGQIAVDQAGTVTGEGQGTVVDTLFCNAPGGSTPISFSITFSVAISGSLSGTGDARALALAFTPTPGAPSGDYGAVEAAGCTNDAGAVDAYLFDDVAGSLPSVTVPAVPVSTAISAPNVSGTFTLAPLGSQ